MKWRPFRRKREHPELRRKRLRHRNLDILIAGATVLQSQGYVTDVAIRLRWWNTFEIIMREMTAEERARYALRDRIDELRNKYRDLPSGPEKLALMRETHELIERQREAREAR
jgi:hypothetical protein